MSNRFPDHDTYMAQIPTDGGGCVTVTQVHSEGGAKFARQALMWAFKHGSIPIEQLGDTEPVEVFEVFMVDETTGEPTIVTDTAGDMYDLAAA